MHTLEGVDYIDIVLCPPEFFAHLLIVFIVVVGNKWSVEVRASLCGHSRFHWPNAVMTVVLTINLYKLCLM